MKLHTYGLLNNSFRPASTIRTLRSYWRQRGEHVRAAAVSIQRMQKVLTEMNLQLHNVISDLSGLSGMRILRAIVQGERDPQKLAALRHYRIKASEEEIVRSLEGNWREELLFVLKQELDTYDTYRRKVTEVDVEVEKHLLTYETRPRSESALEAEEVVRKTYRASGNRPGFDLRSELIRITGVDLTRIEGVDVLTAQTLISEVGLDMTRWKRESNFASWLGLCPSQDISGGKVLRRGTRKVVNRAATALRMAATTLLRSQSYLGAQFRRFRARMGMPKAITAMAHKLARLIYRMLRYGQEYVVRSMEQYEQKYRETQVRMLHQKAKELGFQVIETTGVV
jgi:transposase